VADYVSVAAIMEETAGSQGFIFTLLYITLPSKTTGTDTCTLVINIRPNTATQCPFFRDWTMENAKSKNASNVYSIYTYIIYLMSKLGRDCFLNDVPG